MSKKLKKKIEEICGLHGLDWETRQSRASQILASADWKQSLCNDLQGLSFRDLERTLRGVISERQKKEDSYQRKLDLYNEGRIKKKPMRRETNENDGTSESKSTKSKSPPRTLEQILAQVYAPRVVSERESNDYNWHLQFQWGDESSGSRPSRGSDLSSDSLDDNHSSEQ